MGTENIKINPVNVLWKIEAEDAWEFGDATAAGLGGKYITIYDADGTGYYAWFDENNTDTDPAPSGLTEIEINYAASASANAIAVAFHAAIDALPAFVATINGNNVRVKRANVGSVTTSTIGTVTGTLIILTTIRKGKDFNLGLLQGDIEPSFAPSNLTITAHQYGLTPLASLSQGFDTIELETALLETDISHVREMYQIYGGTSNPGTLVFGAGTSVLGKNMLVEAARLVLKPVNATDDTKNYNMMLALPVPSSFVFSGENPSVLNVTWQGFIDLDFDTNINAVAIGDVFQTGI